MSTKDVTIGVRITPEQRDALGKLAKAEVRSISTYLWMLIDAHLKTAEAKAALREIDHKDARRIRA